MEEAKQPPYEPIYSLETVEFKIFKTYIKTNLANSFIWALKFPAGASILFICKNNNSFYLCVNYWRLNNLIIKNWYSLPFVEKFLHWLGQAKQFAKLNLTSAYYSIEIKDGNKCKMAFQTWYGHFECQIMSLGLFNIPASFYHYINKILTKKLNIFVIIYLDDIFI